MLTIQQFTFNAFAENTYLILSSQSNNCLIVDPGMMSANENRVLDTYIHDNALNPIRIINTHAHIDHILGVQWIKEKYSVPFSIHLAEASVLGSGLHTAQLYGLPLGMLPEVDSYLKEGEKIRLDDEEIDVLFTPGHSSGSVSFYYSKGNWIISGDVLFQESIGRTDLPGGDFDTLAKSIKNELYTLPDHTKVYSGHGSTTTIGHEKVNNPFVRI